MGLARRWADGDRAAHRAREEARGRLLKILALPIRLCVLIQIVHRFSNLALPLCFLCDFGIFWAYYECHASSKLPAIEFLRLVGESGRECNFWASWNFAG